MRETWGRRADRGICLAGRRRETRGSRAGQPGRGQGTGRLLSARGLLAFHLHSCQPRKGTGRTVKLTVTMRSLAIWFRMSRGWRDPVPALRRRASSRAGTGTGNRCRPAARPMDPPDSFALAAASAALALQPLTVETRRPGGVAPGCEHLVAGVQFGVGHVVGHPGVSGPAGERAGTVDLHCGDAGQALAKACPRGPHPSVNTKAVPGAQPARSTVRLGKRLSDVGEIYISQGLPSRGRAARRSSLLEQSLPSAHSSPPTTPVCTEPPAPRAAAACLDAGTPSA